MRISKAILLVALCVAAVCAEYESYAGWKVVRANIEHEKQMNAIAEWDLDVWTRESNLALGLNDIRVNQTHIDKLAQLQVNYEFLIEDLGSAIAEEKAALEARDTSAVASIPWFNSYKTYPEQQAFLQNLSVVYSHLMKYNASIGKTIQNNDIFCVVITGTSNNANKKKIFFSGQQHAREWIASATVHYQIHELVSRYATDSTVKAILDNAILHICPLVNPDGYLFSWSTTRLWRKNRRLNTGGSYGVDLNRNWDDGHWGGEGSSGTPTSDTYRGTAANSEPETQAIVNYVNRNGPFAAGIDWHCYSQLILRPWGWTRDPPANDAEAKLVGDTMRARILEVHRMAYTSQASWQLYFTTGSAQDWYFNKAQMPLSYTIELRDTGNYGFLLPANQIVPTGQENWNAVLYFCQYVINKN